MRKIVKYKREKEKETKLNKEFWGEKKKRGKEKKIDNIGKGEKESYL